MKDIVLAWCRDEADIIEAFVRFYLAMGFDEIHLVDNGSKDNTLDILMRMSTEGLPVHTHRDDRWGMERYWSDSYQRVGAQTSARWLFFLDVDEIIFFPDGAKKYLDRLPGMVNCLRLNQKEMYPLPEPAPGPYGPLLTDRSAPAFDDTTKVVTRFCRGAKVYGGKHHIDIDDAVIMCPEDICIRHYMYRSVEQAEHKVLNRVRNHRSYSVTDLAEFATLGVPETLKWFKECEHEQQASLWKGCFSLDIPFVRDRTIAEWVHRCSA
jgi:hypothetical protein